MVKTALVLVLIVALSHGCYLCIGEVQQEKQGWFNGFIDGLKISPDFPSPCLRKISEVDDDFSNMMKNFGDIFRYGDLSLYFDSVSEFANLANDVDTSISICQLDMITNQLENLFTATMGSSIAVRISAKQESLIRYWKGFIDEYPTNKYESGYNFGKFFSIIFEYRI